MKYILTLTLLLLPPVFFSEESKVYFIEPRDRQEVTSPFRVKFGLQGMGVAPAGVSMEKTGHHHLLVNLNKLPDLDVPIPSSENHIHFGGGQTETVINLPPGVHSLQLLLGDKYHIPHNPPLFSETIHVKVISK